MSSGTILSSITNCSLLLPLLVLLSPRSFASAKAASSSAVNKPSSSAAIESPYKIIFDGGSTGSRLHIFEFVENENDDDSENDTPVECVRRGSSRANVPLSDFGRPFSEQTESNPLDPSHVAAHLLPLFDYAADIIPSQYHASTGVYYQATAGMRLLEPSEQDAVYDAMYEGLTQEESFVFRGMRREDLATLSGEMEAYYGALAANFLQGIIDTELHVVGANNENERMPDHPVGALDMGGSSTQIVYIANQDEVEQQPNDTDLSAKTTMCPVKPLSLDRHSSEESQNKCKLSDEHFFSTSYLSYGVDQIRMRLWDTLVKECLLSNTCDASSKRIPNPCANKGYSVEHEGFTLIGSGDTEECIKQMQRLIPHPDVVHDWDEDIDEWQVGGVEHPPIRGKFLAMSLYFFSLDSLRVFSEPDAKAHDALEAAWPTPSIEELQNALDGLCSREWQGDMELQEGVHSFTRKEVLPHRCLESVYMVTLLKDGYGFRPKSRDITFTFLIDGDEVEWTLGMALAMNANEKEQTSSSSATVTTTTFDYNINETGNTLLEEERIFQQEQRRLAAASTHHFFGATMPPTHCC